MSGSMTGQSTDGCHSPNGPLTSPRLDSGSGSGRSSSEPDPCGPPFEALRPQIRKLMLPSASTRGKHKRAPAPSSRVMSSVGSISLLIGRYPETLGPTRFSHSEGKLSAIRPAASGTRLTARARSSRSLDRRVLLSREVISSLSPSHGRAGSALRSPDMLLEYTARRGGSEGHQPQPMEPENGRFRWSQRSANDSEVCESSGAQGHGEGLPIANAHRRKPNDPNSSKAIGTCCVSLG